MNIEEFRAIFPDYKIPHYTHFDLRRSLLSSLEYVQKPKNITRHAFYPFIEFNSITYKYTYNEQREKILKEKVRKLHYAAHIDSFIYKYYSIELSKKYEAWLKNNSLAACALAYRTDMKGKCNIHFAAKAFRFLRKQQKAYVIVGDFKDFFPSLDHKYLKQSLLKLLAVPSLPDDWYAVFKSLTKYSAVKRETLLQINELKNTTTDLLEFNKLNQALPAGTSINQAKKTAPGFVQKNINSFGIPQGTSLSGILANIYMSEFDKLVHDFVNKMHGLYMRYCDDIIIILPDLSEAEFTEHYRTLHNYVTTVPRLCLEAKKTNIFLYEQQQLKNISNAFHEQSKYCIDTLNYLGFSFTSRGISISDKAVSKYYYRMYKKAGTIVQNKTSAERKNYSSRNLYLHYSNHHERVEPAHSRIRHSTNLLDYVKRAQAVFKDDKGVSIINKKHLHKIRRKLNSWKTTKE